VLCGGGGTKPEAAQPRGDLVGEARRESEDRLRLVVLTAPRTAEVGHLRERLLLDDNDERERTTRRCAGPLEVLANEIRSCEGIERIEAMGKRKKRGEVQGGEVQGRRWALGTVGDTQKTYTAKGKEGNEQTREASRVYKGGVG
jgi:hypothetical protein